MGWRAGETRKGYCTEARKGGKSLVCLLGAENKATSPLKGKVDEAPREVVGSDRANPWKLPVA